jgi:hypothetical protein
MMPRQPDVPNLIIQRLSRSAVLKGRYVSTTPEPPVTELLSY